MIHKSVKYFTPVIYIVCILLSSVAVFAQEKIPLTPAEQQWISEHLVVRSYLGNSPPNHFLKDGTPQGISVELLNKIGKMYGFEVQYIFGDTWATAMDKTLKTKEIDILPATQVTPERREIFSFSQIYLKSPHRYFH